MWHLSCTQKASGKHQRPRHPAESHCATVRCSHPLLAPRTRPSEERLEFLCSHPIAVTIWSNRRNRGTVCALPEEDAIAEGRMLIAWSGDGRQQNSTQACFAGHRVLQGIWLVFQTFVFSGCIFEKKRSLVWSPRSPETNIATGQVLLTGTPHLYSDSEASMLKRCRPNGTEQHVSEASLVMITRFVTQWRHSVATNCLPSVRFLFENKCACCKHTETIDDVLEKLVSLLRHLLQEVCVHICNMCALELRSCNTTCTVLSSHPDTMRSVCEFHNSAASTKRYCSY